MVASAAAVPGCAWPVDAGRWTPEGDRGSATSPSRRLPSCAAGRVQTGAGVVEATISAEQGDAEVGVEPGERDPERAADRAAGGVQAGVAREVLVVEGAIELDEALAAEAVGDVERRRRGV